MSAQQAVSLVKDRVVIIIPSKTIPQGISAMLSFDAGLSAEENLNAMTSAMARVKTGQITFAARDSEFGGIKIRENDILALSDGKLVFSGKDPVKCAVKLVKSMADKNSEFITIIYGESISLQQAQMVKSMVETSLKGTVEINLVNGQQPIYHFILSVE